MAARSTVFDSRPRLGECTSRWQNWAIILNCHPTMLTIKRTAMCSTRALVHLTGCTLHSPSQFTMWIRQNPLWLWNPEEMSPEIQNKCTSGPQKLSKSLSKDFFLKNGEPADDHEFLDGCVGSDSLPDVNSEQGGGRVEYWIQIRHQRRYHHRHH